MSPFGTQKRPVLLTFRRMIFWIKKSENRDFSDLGSGRPLVVYGWYDKVAHVRDGLYTSPRRKLLLSVVLLFITVSNNPINILLMHNWCFCRIMVIQRAKVDQKRLTFWEIDDFLRFPTQDFWKKTKIENHEKNILTQT